MTPIIEALTRVEFNSKRYPVENLDYGIFQANISDNMAKLPEANQMIPEVGELWGRVTFDTQLAGSGTRGTAGDIDYLLTNSGLGQAVTPATSIVSTLVGPSGVGAGTINVYPGNIQKFAVALALGNVQFEFTPGRPCMAHWAFDGSFTTPSTTAGAASLTSDSRNPPICKGLTATVASQTLVLKRVLIDLGNVILSPRSDIAGTNGIQAPCLTSQQPTFEITYEHPALTTLDAWSKLTARNKIALAITLGSVSGNIFAFAIDGYQVEMPAVAVGSGIFEQTIKCKMSRESGDTQLTITNT